MSLQQSPKQVKFDDEVEEEAEEEEDPEEAANAKLRMQLTPEQKK